MTYQIGSRVKWKDVSPIRLGYGESDIGQVVGVVDSETGESGIDVKFGNGDIVHGADERWFELAEAFATQN